MVSPEDSLVSPPRTSKLKPILAVLALAGLVGAGWWMFGRGKGQPEDPARVLIVGPTPELAGFLERKGFDVDHLSFGAAVGEGQAHDPSLDDLAAILEYADQSGFGYVALNMAHGERYEFEAIDYEAEPPPPGTTFAVMSVGDLGRELSYGAVVPEVAHEHPVDEQIGLLLGLFAQPEIAKARTREADNDLMIRFGSAGTVEDVLDYEKAQENMRRQIAGWEALAENERGEPKPTELAAPYERLRGWPLANGAVLLASGRGAWRSADGLGCEWRGDDLEAQFSVIQPSVIQPSASGSEAPAERLPCEALPETLALEEGFAVAPAGDALLIPSNAYVADLWVLAGEGCGFEKRAEIRRLQGGALGHPRANGRTAASQGGRVTWADAKMRAYRHVRFAGVELRPNALRWVSDDVVVIPATLDFVAAETDRRVRRATAGSEDEAAIAPSQLSPVDPGAVPSERDAAVFVRLPGPHSKQEGVVELAVIPVDALLPEARGLAPTLRRLHPIAATSRDEDRAQVAVAVVETREGLALVRLTVGEAAWRNGLATDYDLTAAVEAGRAGVEVSTLATKLPLEARDLRVSPTGAHAAWAAPFGEAEAETDTGTGPESTKRYEIVLLPMSESGGASEARPIRLTDNDRSDLDPRFAGDDGQLLIFTSRYRADDELPPVDSLRALPVPR